MSRPMARRMLGAALLLCLGAMAGAHAGAGPALRLKAFDPATGERFVLTITWEAWPDRADPSRRCRQAALYLGGEIARRMTVDSVGCAE